LNGKFNLACVFVLALLLMAVTPIKGETQKKTPEGYILALQDKDAKVRSEAVWALGNIGDPKAIEPLVGALADKESSVRDWAVLGLVKMGNSSTGSLIAALSSEGAQASLIRPQVAAALGLIKDAKAVDPLILALKDGDNNTRYWAAIALGMINDSRAEDPLIQALGEDNAKVREGAGWAIRAMKGHPAAELFMQLLRSEDSSMRIGAAGALGDSQDEGAVQPLIQAMQDEDAKVQIEAARALGKLNNTSAIEPLIQALGDDDEGLRNEVAAALAKMGGPAVGPLIAVLQDNDSKEAAWALGEIGDARAIEPLLQAFKGDDGGTRTEVVAALVKLNATSDVSIFIQILKNPNEKRDLRLDAALALGELGDIKARSTLLEAMADKDTMIQMNAAKSLTKLGKKGKKI
jgi:HEAT repeat protein